MSRPCPRPGGPDAVSTQATPDDRQEEAADRTIVEHLQGSAGISAKADWYAGDETIKERALTKVKVREAAEAADASYNEAVQSRLPSQTPSLKKGRRSHMPDVLDDMVGLHKAGELPRDLAPACRLLHARDVGRLGKAAALTTRTMQNNLRAPFDDLWAGLAVKPIDEYRKSKKPG
jgi:hypothetical protein